MFAEEWNVRGFLRNIYPGNQNLTVLTKIGSVKYQRRNTWTKMMARKKYLLLKYYNYMLRGKLLLFVSIVSLSEFCVSDIKLVCVVSVFSSMTSFSQVCFIVQYISSSEEIFCSVFDALLANDSSSEEKSSELKLSFEKTSTNRIYIFW